MSERRSMYGLISSRNGRDSGTATKAVRSSLTSYMSVSVKLSTLISKYQEISSIVSGMLIGTTIWKVL